MPSVAVERETRLYVGDFPFNAELERGEIGLAAWFNLLIVWRTQREGIQRRADEEVRAFKNRDRPTLDRLQAERDRLEEDARRFMRGDDA